MKRAIFLFSAFLAAACFSAPQQINVKTDTRLSVQAVGDGVSDDTTAIKGALGLAGSLGGATIYFPPGAYKYVTSSGSPMTVASGTTFKGAGPRASVLNVFETNASAETDNIATWGGISLSGSSNVGFQAIGINFATQGGASIWNRGGPATSNVFFAESSIQIGNGKTFFVQGVTNLRVSDCVIDSDEDPGASGAGGALDPVFFQGDAKLSFTNNHLSWLYGRARFGFSTNVLIEGNTFIRNAQSRDVELGTAIESGGIDVSFDSGLRLESNSMRTVNGPSGEASDGEAILSQQGSTLDVLDYGTATAASSTTLTDSNALWGTVTTSRLAQYPSTAVVILSGGAIGQVRTVQSFDTTAKSLTVSQAWYPVPAPGSLYSILTWTLSNALIRGNRLTDNPTGISIYDGCYNCTIQDNTLVDSRGILLRAADSNSISGSFPEGREQHELVENVQITGNTILNQSGVTPAYLALDVESFTSAYHGVGQFNVQVGNNIVSPYPANPSAIYPGGATEIIQEGYFPCFLFATGAADPVLTVYQKIGWWNNLQVSAVNYTGAFMALPWISQSCVNGGN